MPGGKAKARSLADLNAGASGPPKRHRLTIEPRQIGPILSPPPRRHLGTPNPRQRRQDRVIVCGRNRKS
ncbi:MAG: hypothetical protein U0232_13350 [Thermomicrobiales bacterium]